MDDVVVPTFLIGGAPKAGTTSLYEYLSQHPDVCMSARKETGVFMENYDRGLRWLSETYYRHYDGEHAVGEASAGVMQKEECARRIHDTLPEVKLIFLLRGPVERIYSHYRFLRGVDGLEEWRGIDGTESFSELIRAEGTEWRRVHLDLGMYYKHLTRFEQFFSREQMLVLLFRDLCESPNQLVEQCYEFVGVEASFAPRVDRRHNVSHEPRSQGLYRFLEGAWSSAKEYLDVYSAKRMSSLRRTVKRVLTQETKSDSMDETDREYLRRIYAEPNRKLEEWLGRDLSHWH